MFIKPGNTLLLLDAPAGYQAQIGRLPARVTVSANLQGPADVIQCFVSNRKELEDALPRAKAALAPKGSLWITYPKLTSRLAGDLNRDTINAYAMTIGLQGIAMISIDDDWSALRLKVVA
jgi:hypothetical protein